MLSMGVVRIAARRASMTPMRKAGGRRMPAKPLSHKHHRVQIDAHSALDDLAHYRLHIDDGDLDDPVLVGPDGARIETWRDKYPYNERLDRGDYETGKRALQIELLKL